MLSEMGSEEPGWQSTPGYVHWRTGQTRPARREKPHHQCFHSIYYGDSIKHLNWKSLRRRVQNPFLTISKEKITF